MSAEYGNFPSGKQIGMLPSSSCSEIMVRSLTMAKLGILSLFSDMEIGSITFTIPWACSGCKNQVGKSVVERQLDHRSNATLVNDLLFNSEDQYQIRQSGIVVVFSNATFSRRTLNEILIQKPYNFNFFINCISFKFIQPVQQVVYFRSAIYYRHCKLYFELSPLLKMVRSSVCSRKLHTSFNDSTTVRLSCLVTLLHFLICNVVLATCEITDCGVQSGETSFFLQHIVFFVGLQDGMMFKDCIGTIMPSAPNFTYSDTVITESVPMVVLGALYLQNVHVQGIHIRRMSSPFGREEANAVNIPFNFAIIKLASHVQFSFAAIPVCLKSDLVINDNSTCYMPNIHSVFLNGFGLPFKLKIIYPLESCALLIPQLKLSPLKHICAVFIMPPVLVSSDLLDAIPCGFRYTSLHFHDHLLFFIFGHGSAGMFKDCIGTIMLTNESSMYGDLILTSKYCLDSGCMRDVKVMPSYLSADYLDSYGFGVRKIIAPAERQSWKKLNLPYNFALLRLSAMIPISNLVTPVCLPAAHIQMPRNTPCYLPKTTYQVNQGFSEPFRFSRMPNFWCTAMSKEIIITPGMNFCAVLHVASLHEYHALIAQIPNSLFEGAPLLCLHQDRFYQVGIFDWLKVFKDNLTRPIALFSRVAAITPLIEQAIVNNISSEHNSFLSWIEF
ncbi:hypothetical protein T01_13224 [Trichinella spiralis]|uniref:Peptidase S1 domain-containing protein n=1 Tax=Trichinella spiralis TaxID=6334 RepID=A0A0V1C1D9_TRISP|nr:hypothetical protein T01_13224 [Trichinella spiralis]